MKAPTGRTGRRSHTSVSEQVGQEQHHARQEREDQRERQHDRQVGRSVRATSAGLTPPTEQATSRLTPTGGRNTEIPWVATMTAP